MCWFLTLMALILAVVVIDGSNTTCATDSDCGDDECCVKALGLNTTTACKQRGSVVGELCGGMYFCQSCHDGMECVGFSSDRIVANDACQLPANGTCQFPVTELLTGLFSNSSKHVFENLFCETDADCQPENECCAKRFEGLGKVCRRVGDRYGDSCGGDYFCSNCHQGLDCIPSSFPTASKENQSSTAVPVNESAAYDSVSAGGNLIGGNTTVDYLNETSNNSTAAYDGASAEESLIGDNTTVDYLDETTSDNVCLPPANGTCRYPANQTALVNTTSLPLPLCHIAFKHPCVEDSDCRQRECCVLHYNGKYKICRDKGDAEGKACGGDYFCSSCRNNLRCVGFPSTNSTLNVVDDVSRSCATPANGTCQNLWKLVKPSDNFML